MNIPLRYIILTAFKELLPIAAAAYFIMAASGCATMGRVLKGAGDGLASSSRAPRAIQTQTTNCTSLVNGQYITTQCN